MVPAFLVLVAGCTTSEPLADQYRSGAEQGYISGDGTYREYLPEERGAPVEFEGLSDEGDLISSSDYAGEVYVVNFWYAACPPCRVEAADLEALSQEYAEQGVEFVGVNIYDAAPTSQAFARKFGVTYPSIVDVNDVAVQFAFSETVPPNAVPVTLVMDQQGRVAARWSGVIHEPSILAAMIDQVLLESDPEEGK